jgi:SAM-dependent methyltransferase
LLALGANRFDKAVCTMALMDMPEIRPLIAALPRLLKPGGVFVFSVLHPCFHSAAIQRFAELHEEEAGRHVVRAGVKISLYLSAFARKSEGIIGQPEPQWLFHRPMSALFRAGFEAGFVIDGFEEPALPKGEAARAGVRWDDMPDIPPVLVVRMKSRAASDKNPKASQEPADALVIE